MPTPLPIAAILRRARNAKSPKERHDTAYYAWEATLRLAVAARPPADPVALALPSTGAWAAALLPSLAESAVIDAPAALAALALLSETGSGRAKAPRAASPRRLVEALPAYRNAVLGHGATRDAAFYDRAAETLLDGLASLLDAGALWPSPARLIFVEAVEIDPDGGRRARLLSLDERGAVIEDPRGSRDAPETLLPRRLYLRDAGAYGSLHPWLLFDETEGRERILFWNGRSRGPTYLDYVTGEVVKGKALLEAFPGLGDDLARLFGAAGAASPSPGGASPSPAAASPAPSPTAGGTTTDDASDRRIDGYVLHERLGAGGMGIVRRAVQESLGRSVALKLLPPGAAHDAESVRRFRREVAALSRCDHAHVVKVLDSGEDRGGPWYAMELVDGPDLAAVAARLRSGLDLDAAIDAAAAVARGARGAREEASGLPAGARSLGGDRPRALAALMRDAARGLAHLHDNGITHRDVKPGNIMIAADLRRIVVMDLGLASLADASRTLTRDGASIVGTLRYAAPEQLSRGHVATDRRADVYSLGATFYELLAGRPVVDTGDEASAVRQVLFERPAPIRRLAPGVPADLAVIVEKTLEKDPARRYESAAALADDLDAFLAERPISARPASVGYLVGLAIRRNKALAALGALVAILLLVGLPLFLHAREEATREARSQMAAAARGSWEASRHLRSGFDTLLASLKASLARGNVAGADRMRAVSESTLDFYLRALEHAGRWDGLVGGSEESRAAVAESALALAGAAAFCEQWGVAVSALARAREAGADETRVRIAQEEIDRARRRVSDERRAAVTAVLDAAAKGRLYEKGRTHDDALFEIVAHRHPETVSLVAAALDASTDTVRKASRAKLLEAATPTAFERELGEEPIEGLAAAADALAALAPGTTLGEAKALALRRAWARLETRVRGRHVDSATGDRMPPRAGDVLASAESQALGPEGIVTLRLCCDALGRIGIRGGALPSLARFIAETHDPRLAAPAAEALARIGGDEASEILFEGSRRSSDRRLFLARAGMVLERRPVVLRIDEADAAARLDRSAFLRAIDDKPGELADLESAVKLDPGSAAAWAALARALYESAERARSEEACGRALALAPDNESARGTLAVIQSEDGGTREKALEEIDRAVARAPDSALKLRQRAIIRARMGDNDGALRDLGRALELDPDERHAWIMRARVHGDVDRLPEAISDWTRAIELRPLLAWPWRARGFSRREAGDHRGALDDASRSLELAPGDPVGWRLRALSRISLDDLDGAVADATRAIELDPSDEDGWYARASARFERMDFVEAAADIEQALALDPDDAWNVHLRAMIRAMLGLSEEALVDAERAVRLDPTASQLRFSLANRREARYDFDGALADYDEAVRLRPDSAPYRAARGDLQRKRGELDLAAQDIEAAVKASPESATPRRFRAELRQARGDLRGAREDLDVALARQPDDAPSLLLRSEVRRRLGDARGALADAERALALGPRQAVFWLRRAAARRALGDTVGANEDIDRALKLEPGDLEALVERGEALLARGDRAGAIADWRRALLLPPASLEGAHVRRLLASAGEAVVEPSARTATAAPSPRTATAAPVR